MSEHMKGCTCYFCSYKYTSDPLAGMEDLPGVEVGVWKKRQWEFLAGYGTINYIPEGGAVVERDGATDEEMQIMAASPEMLNMLEKIVFARDLDCVPSKGMWSEVEAVIKKARGG